jgi:poly(A) polymerase
MKLDELLGIIIEVAKTNGLTEPFMVGGTPRDRILGVIDKKAEIKDIDITTGDKNSPKLAILVHQKLEGSIYNVFDDKHSSVDVQGIHLDFSSNYRVRGIEEELKRLNVKDVTPMKMELYSRDFTINCLLERLDFTGIFDLTGEAIDDIKSKVIRCPINPEITIGSDPRRILRAIKFAIKFGFNIEEGLKGVMLNNRESIKTLPVKFAQDKMTEIATLDSEKGIEMLIEFKLLPLVPLSKTLSDILIQQRKIIHAL